MQRYCICTALCSAMLMLASAAAHARPISYPGGWMVMQMNNAEANTVEAHYTLTPRYSVGYTGQYWRDKDWLFQGVELNALVKRWNQPSSQANFYLRGGVGAAYSDAGAFDGKTEPSGFVSTMLDWEDRRFLVSYENHAHEAGDIDSFFTQTARLGVAPYVGDYGDLHTWLMLQFDHRPGSDDTFSVTPLVRLFKGETLVEAGVSDDGDVLFNWTLLF